MKLIEQRLELKVASSTLDETHRLLKAYREQTPLSLHEFGVACTGFYDAIIVDAEQSVTSNSESVVAVFTLKAIVVK